MRSTALLLTAGCLLLGACTQADGSKAMGRVGSPAWMATATPAAKLATYQAACESYGYHPEDVQMPACIQREAQEARAHAAEAVDEFADSLEDWSANQQAQQPIRLQTTCTTIGQFTNCH
jgi:outer membrane lipoprotein-sorting protein